MEAILLVRGKGTRLRPLTVGTPRPMIRIAGAPLLAHQITRAKAAGVERIVVVTAYRREVFEDYFGDGARFGLEIEYVPEPEPLDTGGAVRSASDRLTGAPDDPVLILNEDVLSDVDLADLVAAYRERDADVVMHLARVPLDKVSSYGMVPTDEHGWVTAFLEKPQRSGDIVTDQVNAGTYVFRRSVIGAIPAGRRVSLERETLASLLASNAKVLGVVETSYWRTLRTPQDFARGSADLVMHTIASPAVPRTSSARFPDALVLPATSIGRSAKLADGSVLGQGSRVGANTVILGSIVGNDCVIGNDVQIRDSIVGDRVRIGPGCVLDGAVIGDSATVGARNELLHGVRVWTGAVLADLAIRFSSDDA